MKYKLTSAMMMAVILFALTANAQTTDFTYQGSLKDSGLPANGNYDFEFRLFDALSGGNQLGATISLSGVTVTTGVFSVSLNFGMAFPGGDRYLEISVKQAGSGQYTLLNPRQLIRSAPYSVKSISSETASNSLSLGGVAANQYVLTGDPRLTDARSPTAGSANYIQNTTSQQFNSNFNISGNGFVGGNIGVGTLTPQGRLHGEGGAGVGVYGESSGNTGVYGIGDGTAGGVIGFSVGGKGVYGSTNTGWAGYFDGKMYVNDKLGIGTTTPSSLLHVKGVSPVRILGDTTTLAGSEYVDFFARSSIFGSDLGGMRIQRQTGTGDIDTLFFAAPSGNSAAEVMRLTGDGRVGIGTTGSIGKLSVNGGAGNAVFGTSTTLAGVYGTSNSGNGVSGYSTSGYGVHGTAASGYGVYGHSDSSYGVFGSSGGTGGTGGYAGYFDGDVYVSNLLYLQTIGSSSATDTYVCYSHAGPHYLGNCSSSLRFKRDVRTFLGGLNIITRLRPIAFNWKQDGTPAIGLAAEEVESIEPLLTFRDDNGEIGGVRYNRLSAVFVNAIKEQQAQIAQMRRTIGIMQKQITRLRAHDRRHLGKQQRK